MDDSFKWDGVAGCSALPELLEGVDELKKAFMLQACSNEQLLSYERARTKKLSLSLSLSRPCKTLHRHGRMRGMRGPSMSAQRLYERKPVRESTEKNCEPTLCRLPEKTSPEGSQHQRTGIGSESDRHPVTCTF